LWVIERFADRIPPGYADADKEKNPNQASFFHNQIKYPRKFGDLILWRQLIGHVKSQGIKFVILVTADRKEDWWWREQGKTIGVQPELVREIRRLGSVDLFWMYSSAQFLEHAKMYAQAKVSDQAVAELQEVAESPRRTLFSWAPTGTSSVRGLRDAGGTVSRTFEQYQRVEAAVYDWLTEEYGEVLRTDRFPDFIVAREDDLHGYEVRFVRNLDRSVLLAGPVINAILRGYLEVNEGRLSTFTIIVAMGTEDFYLSHLDQIRDRLGRTLKRYPIAGIIVGLVLSDGRFEPLIHQTSAVSDEQGPRI
jgi:hypothetical protein